MAKGDALKGHIEALRNAIPELKGVLLASNEGLPIAHSFSNGADPNRVAAMAAAASSLGRRISDSMSAGTLGRSLDSGRRRRAVRLFGRLESSSGGDQPARRKRRTDSPGSPHDREGYRRSILIAF